MLRHTRGAIIRESLCSYKQCRSKTEHIFYSYPEKRYVPQFSNMTCTKCEVNTLCIFTNNIATLNRVLHRLFIISFIFVNYILCVRLDLVKSGLLECPTAFLHLITIHQPCAFRRKINRWNACDSHPNNTVSKFLVLLAIYRRSMSLNLSSVWSPQKKPPTLCV
jgi:hypothetical protein